MNDRMQSILPQSLQPDAVALAHSAKLRHLIDKSIEQSGGWIDFAQFMQLALYAPGLGYYSAGSVKLGSAGDFVTAPELTPLFAQTLANHVGPVIRALYTAPRPSAGLPAEHNQPIPSADVPVILELGAGTGRLALDLLQALGQQEALPERYLILELSPDLRARQQATLAALPPAILHRVQWCAHWPQQITGVVLANEVLDAMPVHRLRWEQGHWEELGVSRHPLTGHWVHTARPLIHERLRQALPQVRDWRGTYETEVNLAAQEVMGTLAHSLRQGQALFFDYGFPAREFYHPQRNTGTLMCHYRHYAHTDPFCYPGLQDITAHVDFTALARVAGAHGLAVLDYQTQAAWLIQNGITTLLAQKDPQAVRQYLPAVAAAQKLLSPAEMGELFKVLVLGRGQPHPGAQQALGLAD